MEMKPMRWGRILLGGLLALAGLTASANSNVGGGTAVDSLLKMEGIDSSYAITYHDVDGKVVTKADFVAALVQKHLTFNLEDDQSKHTAVLRLNAAGSPAAKRLAAAEKSLPARMIRPGKLLPPFRLATAGGGDVDNEDLRGRPVLINFFFAHCAGCIEETPALNAYASAHPHMRVLAVTFDDAVTAAGYVKQRRFAWPVAYGAQSWLDALGINAYPTLALVDAEGRVLDIRLSANVPHGGDGVTPKDLNSWVTGVLAKQSAK
ncbi:MAG: TlpA family protein disulfide reductase [Xanthomonadaceae bacterium]|nr:TlpA family protein disulfide reductase [Xanthomonadaceae bacterium]